MTKTIKIPFDKADQRFLSFVFTEVFAGGSTRVIQNLLGKYVSDAEGLQPVVRHQAQSEAEFIELTETQWRVMYHAMNAVIYGLGPSELQACTGQLLHSACNLNLRICSHVWDGCQGKYEWADSTSRRVGH